MHKKYMGIFFSITLILLLTAISVSGKDKDDSQKTDDAMCVPMGSISLKPPESVEQKKDPVSFPHAVHFIYDCKACHHKWEQTKPITNCTTSGCHDLQESPGKPVKYLQYTNSTIKYYKYAFHKQCIGCHKESNAKRAKLITSHKTINEGLPAAAPTGCKGCHSE